MQSSFCDVCGNLIKIGCKKFMIVSKETIEEVLNFKEYRDYYEYAQDNYKKDQKLEVKEICENCKKVYNFLFQLRKKEVNDLLKSIKASYKLKQQEIKE